MRRDEIYRACLVHREEVYGFARRLCGYGALADADDLLQEVYARAFDGWKNLREPERARAWLFTIARRTFLNRCRRERLERRFTVLEGGELPDVLLPPASVEPGDVLEALRALPEQMATTVALCDLWGFRYQEIADILACPVGTVRSRLARGRAALVERLGRTIRAESIRESEGRP